MACSDWPLCNGKLIPSLSGIVGVQFGHRVAAAITLFLIAYITFIAVRRYKERRDIYWGSVVSLVLIVLQVISGALTIWFNLNLVTSLVHTTLISVLFGMLCYLALQVRQTAGAKDLHEKNQVPVKKVLV